MVGCRETDCLDADPGDGCAAGEGRPCTDSSQCSAFALVCDTRAKRCVRCTAEQAAACTGATPVCEAEGRCRACSAHVECGSSNVCLPDGACADAAEVAYVRSPGGTDNPTCSLAAPCTKIAAALATNRPYVKLHGRLDEEVAIVDRNVTILADPGTVLTASTSGGVLGVGGSSHVAIYDLAIHGARGFVLGVVLWAIAGEMETPPGTTLTLSRVSISETHGAVLAAGGTINIHRSKIFNNMGVGIAIVGAEFDIENNVITGNGDPRSNEGNGVAIRQIDTGTRILRFNTIAFNHGPADYPHGVKCESLHADLTLSNNIIYGNGGSGAKQVGGDHCSWSYSIIGPDAAPGVGVRNLDPQLTRDFHLAPGSPAIDHADPRATTAVDFDGDDRPQGRRRDIGADEYAPP